MFSVAACTAPTPRFGWQAPPDAREAQLSAVPGHYNFDGLTALRVNGVLTDPVTALEFMRHNFALELGQIQPEPNATLGHARIVLPDHDRLRLISGLANRVASGGVDYIAEERRLDLHLLADTVIRSNLFASVELVEQNDTVAPDQNGADYLIWFQIRSVGMNNAGPWIGRWLMKRGFGPVTGNLSVDPGTPVGPLRLQSFVKSVRLAADGNGRIIAGRSTSSDQVTRTGSGIVVDAQGHVLTNNHVIANCSGLQVTDAQGNDATAELVASDADNDLALIKTQHHWSDWARFRSSDTLRPGEPVVVTGFPLSGLVSPEMAVTTGSLTAVAGAGGDTRRIQLSAPMQPGNSGGPVLDDNGKVIGIASSVLNGLVLAIATGTLPQNVNFAIKTDTAREFLAANQLTLDSSRGHAASGAASVGELARRFTVKIACMQ
jgi:S1-C subfamily serine protease